ncbi:MAG TPA: arsenate reductase ArsC [Desulfomonilaceae bacterium]|nr:arsenate reductase ArsC [Desulfomonilaceae bacterium]
MGRTKVLFVCVQNSARSQIAEALLNHLYGDRFQAESAGIEPGKLNPFAVASMKEVNIDISHKGTRDVFDIWRKGGIYNYVITVCDEASGERCPIFPGVTKRLHWSFDDPATFTGTFEEKLAKTIGVRDQIKEKIQAWVHELNP